MHDDWKKRWRQIEPDLYQHRSDPDRWVLATGEHGPDASNHAMLPIGPAKDHDPHAPRSLQVGRNPNGWVAFDTLDGWAGYASDAAEAIALHRTLRSRRRHHEPVRHTIFRAIRRRVSLR